MAIDPQIVAALKRLNPAAPPQDGEYIARDGGGLARPWDPVAEVRVLLEAGYTIRGLVHGAVGVGKSTELARWERELADVVEVVRVEVTLSKEWSDTGFIQAFAEAITAARGARIPSVSRRLQILSGALRAEPSGELDPASWSWTGDGRPVLLLVDGLDRLELVEAIRAFASPSTLAAEHWPSILYTAPVSMLRVDPNRSRDQRFEQVWHLSPFPVIREDGTVDVAVLEYLSAGLAKRFEGLDVLDHAQDLLERAAVWSGGIPRDAVRILRGAVMAALHVGRVNSRHLDEGLREVRQDLEQSLIQGDREVLREVAASGEFLGDPRLLTANAVIAYEGKERRYFRVHPLLKHLVSEDGSYDVGGL